MLGKFRTQACFSSELGHFHFLGLGLFVGWVVWGLLLMLFQAKRPGSFRVWGWCLSRDCCVGIFRVLAC